MEKSQSSKSSVGYCVELFCIFAKIGLVLIGGGYVMLPLLQREVVNRRKWVTEKELLNYYAIGQSTPGIIAINTATFIGYKQAGVFGALCATLGVVFPAVVIICILAMAYAQFKQLAWIEHVLRGARVAVSVLLLFTISDLIRKHCRDRIAITILIAAFLALAVFDVSPVPVIIAAAVFGGWFYRKAGGKQ